MRPERRVELDDAELVRRCVARDEDAWRLLLERHGRLILAIARRAGNLDQDAAEEVFQSVAATLARRLHLLADPQCLPKWLIVTTTRRARLHARGRGRLAALPEAWDPAEDSEPVDEIVARSERAARVRDALEKLPERDRELLLDLFERELPYTEIAARFGLKVGSLGSLRARALAKLRRALAEAERAPVPAPRPAPRRINPTPRTLLQGKGRDR